MDLVAKKRIVMGGHLLLDKQDVDGLSPERKQGLVRTIEQMEALNPTMMNQEGHFANVYYSTHSGRTVISITSNPPDDPFYKTTPEVLKKYLSGLIN